MRSEKKATMGEALGILRDRYGFDSFRPGQDKVVSALLSGKDVLGVMPTGAGKSICYQVPAIALGGTTIVVSPLIALMKDQVDSLTARGVPAAYINSSMKPSLQEEVARRAEAGEYEILYVAPERLGAKRFREVALALDVPLVAIDEAHCISSWGDDFRPAYKSIGAFLDSLPSRPLVAAFTATATRRVRRDIVESLGLSGCETVVSGFDRPNIRFSSAEMADVEKEAFLLRLIRRRRGQSGIVYCTTRKAVDAVASFLEAKGVSCAGYHAGLRATQRTAIQNAFMDGSVDVIVCTCAFGMGVDKPDVRYVVNYNLPLSVEDFYQEAGRAGRDGLQSFNYLLWNANDYRTAKFLATKTDCFGDMPGEQVDAIVKERLHRLYRMLDYAKSETCLRAFILSYFGDAPAEHDPATCCSVCAGSAAGKTASPAPSGREPERIDVSAQAKALFACSLLHGDRLSPSAIASFVVGEESGEFGAEEAAGDKYYGAAKGMTAGGAEVLLKKLARKDILVIGEDGISRGPKWRDVFSKRITLGAELAV